MSRTTTAPSLDPVDILHAWAETVGVARFEVGHLDPKRNPDAFLLYDLACDYLKGYDGSFAFLAGLSAKIKRNGYPTDAAAKGVLNCMRGDGRRREAAEVDREIAADGAYANSLVGLSPRAAGPARIDYVAVPDGMYTVVFGDDDDYVTIRIADWKTRADGTRVASHLVGPDNENDFAGFATISPDGAYALWSRYRGDARLLRALDVVAGATDDGLGEMQLAYAMRSGRCAVCGRRLTVPASLHRGVGPDCARAAAA